MSEAERPADADLARWCDAARADGLPVPTTDRWSPLRAGVVNLWEFDVAEYWFAGGRVQLVGQNQSGKSSLMTLTSLIMLAGDLSPSLVDTFGDRHKSFRYYVEPTTEPTDRRESDGSTSRGWTWVELGRRTPDGPRYYTLLLYAQAKRGGGLTRVWATAEGGSRVRAGLDLHQGSAVRAPGDVVGLEVAASGSEYQDRVARRLWGFAGADRLDAVVRILKVLRTPHLGQRLDPDFFTERMRDALLALDSGEVDKLADGWEQLERLAADRDEARTALDATKRFVQRSWGPWADAVLRRHGDALAASVTRFDNVTRDERRARVALEEAEQRATTTRRVAERARRDHDDAQTRYELHLRSPAYQEAAAAVERAHVLGEQATSAQERAAEARRRFDRAVASMGTRTAERDAAHVDRDLRTGAVDAAASWVVTTGEPARFPDGWADWVAAGDLTRLAAMVRERRGQVRDVRRLLRTHREAAWRFEQADSALAAAHEAATHRRRVADAADTDVEVELLRTSEHLEAWAAELGSDAPSTAVRDGWVRAVTELAGSEQPRSVLPDLVRTEWLAPLTGPLLTQAALESEAERRLQGEAAAADAEADAVEAEHEPAPLAPVSWTRRPRPAVGPTGAPLWWLLDPVDELPAAELDRIEAALDAMGLLDAWVSEDGRWSSERDGAEIVLTPASDGSAPERSLADVLTVTGGVAGDGLGRVVAQALTVIGYAPAGQDLPTDRFAIVADGRWCSPLAAGRVDPAVHGAELIGAAARAGARARRVAELRTTAAGARSEAGRAAARAAAAMARVERLGLVAESLSDASLVRLALAAGAARTELERADAARLGAAERQQQALARADDARAEVLGATSAHRLPDDDDALDAVVAAVDATDAAVGALGAALVALRAATERLTGAERLLAEAAGARDREQAASEQEEDRARTARVESETAARRLAEPERDLLAEGELLEAERNRLRGELDRLADDLVAHVRTVEAATTTLQNASEERERATAEREVALQAWSVPVAAGLARARGLDDSSGPGLTSSVEQARAARVRLRPPGWPDGDDLDAKRARTERLFELLVIAVADLGHRLQALGGRYASVEEPQEGGVPTVVLRVDSLGEPLAPVKAVAALERSVDELTATYDQQLGSRLEELLSSTFVDHLRERLAGVLALVGSVNRVLAAHPTGATRTTLRLGRVSAPGHEDGFAVLEALRGTVVGDEGVQRQIRTFLERQIRTAQQEGQASGADWKERLADLLDYRQWFAMITEYSVPAGGGDDGTRRNTWRPLTRQVHGRDSGGGKAVTLLQPLLATLVALYAEAPHGPRPLWLDEAFTGVDDVNRTTMLDLLVSFDLDFVAAGPDTLVAVSAVPSAAIWHVTRAPAPIPGVELSLALWAGDRLVPLPTPDAEPLAVVAAPEPLESLFSEDDES